MTPIAGRPRLWIRRVARTGRSSAACSVVRALLPAMALGIQLSGLLACSSSEPNRPNIVLIYVDDLDFDEIGVYDSIGLPSYDGARALGLGTGRASSVSSR